MLIIFDRQDVFTYLKLLINSHNLKVTYEAHAQDFVLLHHTEFSAVLLTSVLSLQNFMPRGKYCLFIVLTKTATFILQYFAQGRKNGI